MIYPEAEWVPGRNAGYTAGHTTMTTAVCHYTVGRDSTGIGVQGYFTFLVARDGHVKQFAEADAVTWHAGDPWNGRGPGVEVEYLPGQDAELWTPPQEAAVARLCAWLQTLGISNAFYDGPRIGSWSGFITHRSLIQTGDSHSDYWPYLPTTTPPLPLQEPAMDYILARTDDGLRTLCTALGETEGIDVPYAEALIAGGMVQVKIDGVGYTNMLNIRRAQRAAFLKSIPASGGGAVPLKVTLTGTATP